MVPYRIFFEQTECNFNKLLYNYDLLFQYVYMINQQFIKSPLLVIQIIKYQQISINFQFNKNKCSLCLFDKKKQSSPEQDQEQETIKNEEMNNQKLRKASPTKYEYEHKKISQRDILITTQLAKIPQNKTSVGLNFHKAFKDFRKEISNSLGNLEMRNKKFQQYQYLTIHCHPKYVICLIKQGFKILWIQNNLVIKNLINYQEYFEIDQKNLVQKTESGQTIRIRKTKAQLQRIDPYYNTLINKIKILEFYVCFLIKIIGSKNFKRFIKTLKYLKKYLENKVLQ